MINEKLIPTDIKLENDISIITNNIDKININNRNYTHIYINVYNVTDPKQYIKDIIYLNCVSILIIKNNNKDNNKNCIKYKNILNNLNKEYINYESKIKIKDNYFKFVFLNKKYKFDNFKWFDIYNFYTLFEKQENIIDQILKNKLNYNKINRKINIIKKIYSPDKKFKNRVFYKLNIKYIFLNIQKNYDKIF